MEMKERKGHGIWGIWAWLLPGWIGLKTGKGFYEDGK